MIYFHTNNTGDILLNLDLAVHYGVRIVFYPGLSQSAFAKSGLKSDSDHLIYRQKRIKKDSARILFRSLSNFLMKIFDYFESCKKSLMKVGQSSDFILKPTKIPDSGVDL